ncbi:hypothetical protein Tco_0538715 [Tanacetum coccineum]
MGPEVNITRNELGNALIAGLEALTDVGEVWDTIMCLRDEQRKAEAKLANLQHWLTNAEEEIVEKQERSSLKILAWNKVGSEARDKLWDEITLDMLESDKMARVPTVSLSDPQWDDAVGYVSRCEEANETEDKIKEGTLKVDQGTDAITVVLGMEKGGYARGVGSGVTYKRYFDLLRSKQAADERILLLQSQLDAA